MKCRKNAKGKNPKVVRTNKVRIMFSSKCAVCDSKNVRFIKVQGTCGLLTSSETKTPLSKIHVSGNNLFYTYKTKEIVNNFLLAEDRFMPVIHLKQSGLTYSAFGTFTKIRYRIQKIKKARDSRYIYENEQDKACY